MSNDSVIRLLVLDESLNDAEHATSAIRTLGYAVKSARVLDLQELVERLKSEQFDLCLCCVATLSPLPLSDLVGTVSREGQHLPIIAMRSPRDNTSTADMMKAGAVDAVDKGDHEHLKLVVNREFQHVKLAGGLDILKAAYFDSEKRSQMLMDSSRDAISYVHEGMHVHANEAYLELFGFNTLEEIQGAPIMDLVISDDQDTLKSFLRNHADNGEDSLGTQLMHTNGSTFSATMEFSRTTVDGEPGTQIIIRDRVDTRELERQLNLLSQTDQLTGLYNRQHLMKLLQDTCERATQGEARYSLFHIKLEDFEATKNTLGVLGADRVMADVANLLRQVAQQDDVLCRFEDATYTILSVLSDEKPITQYARKILSIVDKFICDVGGKSINPRCSIGIAIIDESTSDPNEVLSRAEKALEKALQRGQTQRIYQPKPGEQTQKQIDQMWTKRLSAALKNNRFSLLYQPIVSLGGDDLERYDVSYSLVDEAGKPTPQSEFIAVAERTGMAKGIDRWVIFNAAKQLAEQIRVSPKTVFFIPLTDSALEDPELFRWIRQLLEQLRLPDYSIVFQMSESSVITHLKQARAMAAALHKINCKISLFEFGAEPNPFQLIKHVPADYVRIHKEFMKNLTTSMENQQAIQSISEKARRHGQVSIAPNVEDAGSLSVLWGLGTDLIQGDFLQAQAEDLAYDFSAMSA
ncbi:MAG: EAL domain-containing protein [Pseudomonadota bacterium]